MLGCKAHSLYLHSQVKIMLYPVAIEKGDDTHAFGVAVPDIKGCYSAGDTLAEAMKQAKAAIEIHLELLAEQGELPPDAKPIDHYYDNKEFDGWIWAVVDIDVTPYMGKASKLNITLPSLLISKIDDFTKKNPNYKSRSTFLQIAAVNEMKKAAYE